MQEGFFYVKSNMFPLQTVLAAVPFLWIGVQRKAAAFIIMHITLNTKQLLINNIYHDCKRFRWQKKVK